MNNSDTMDNLDTIDNLDNLDTMDNLDNLDTIDNLTNMDNPDNLDEYLKYIEREAYDFKYIEHDDMPLVIYEKAVEIFPYNLEYVPEDKLTKEMCLYAFEKCSLNIFRLNFALKKCI